jgi:fluoroquinolone resistance protein
MEAVDFTETDLMGSIFENCQLQQAVFDRTNLEGCDFRASYQYNIDPQINKVKKARFSLDGVGGLLKVFGVLIE